MPFVAIPAIRQKIKMSHNIFCKVFKDGQRGYGTNVDRHERWREGDDAYVAFGGSLSQP